MRIDDRRVNGQIMVDASDVVNGFTIVMKENEIRWVTDVSISSFLDPSVAVSQLLSLLEAEIAVIRFTIFIIDGSYYKVITSPSYTLDNVGNDGITIDLSPFVSDKKLKIDLETGQLSVVAIT